MNKILKVSIIWIIVLLFLTSVGLWAKGRPWSITVNIPEQPTKGGEIKINIYLKTSDGSVVAIHPPINIKIDDDLNAQQIGATIADAINSEYGNLLTAKVDENNKKKVKVKLKDSPDTEKLIDIGKINVSVKKIKGSIVAIRDDPNGEVLMTIAYFELIGQSQSEGVANLRIGKGPNVSVQTTNKKDVEIAQEMVESFNKVYSNTPYKAEAKGNKVEIDNVPCPEGIAGGTTDKSLNYSIGMKVKPDEKPDKINPFNFGIGLNGGWSSWTLGDFGLSKNYFENLGEIPGYSATTKDLSGSPFGGIDLILEYNLPNYHKLGLSVGFQYFPGGTFEQSWSYQDTTSTNTLDLSAFAIPVELFYKPRVAKNLSLKIGGGATFYNAAIDYNSSFSISGQEYSYSGKLKDSGIGGHVSLGAEYSLTKNLSLSVNAGYSFAKLNNFTGTLVDRDGTSTEMLLTMARDEFGEMLSIYPTTEPLPAHSRPAEIDFSGFKFSAGLKYLFKKKKTMTSELLTDQVSYLQASTSNLIKFLTLSKIEKLPKSILLSLELSWKDIAKNWEEIAEYLDEIARFLQNMKDVEKANEVRAKAAEARAKAAEARAKGVEATAEASDKKAIKSGYLGDFKIASAEWEKTVEPWNKAAEAWDKAAEAWDNAKNEKAAAKARAKAANARAKAADAKANALLNNAIVNPSDSTIKKAIVELRKAEQEWNKSAEYFKKAGDEKAAAQASENAKHAKKTAEFAK